MYDLNGKVALVTGAGGEQGLGRAIAVRLAREGADVVVNDLAPKPYAKQSDWPGLPAVVEEIEQLGRRALGVVADVSEPDAVDAMVAESVEKMGRIDILVNNAGMRAGRDRVPVVELEVEVWDRLQRVNVRGMFLCSRAAARHMLERGGGGKIINMSSVSGKRGRARFAAYCTSKFAIIGFTQALAAELAGAGVNVNAICPGVVETERLAALSSSLMPDASAAEAEKAFVDKILAGTPIGRLAAPTDVANMAAFLASSQSDYLTGLSITVAGGLCMD